jgi:hypothetical protein
MSNAEPFYQHRDRMHVEVKKRTEKHGDQDVSAYDVILSGPHANAILAKLDPALRPSLYAQEQGDIIDGTSFTTPRFPQLGVYKWQLEMGRMELIIHDEDDEAESLVLTNREADKFNFSLMQGGTVNFAYRVKLGEMTDEDALMRLLRADNQDMLISLRQVPIEEAADNFDKAEQLAKEQMSPEREAAEKQFFNPAGAQSPEEVVFSDPPA